jgi:2-methylaconitate cis-trans-isomerase PrpF
MTARRVRCVIMRGGTSKAVFLREEDLPPVGEVRDRVILRIFGSPDKRQIDGLGGADPLTSKLAIIGPARTEEADLTYTFGQVEIDHPKIDYKSLCGNISAAVGHFAVAEGMVKPVEPLTTVRVFNTNLNRILRIEVPVKDGMPVEEGTYRVPGVPGTGAKISLDFADTAGGATGALLPTGRAIDTLAVEGFGSIEASLVDIGNGHVFIRARDLGLTGAESPAEIDGDPKLRDLLERIRGAGAARMGMISAPGRSREESPATPILGIVSPPQPYTSYLTGEQIAAVQVDLVSRVMFMQVMHKTYAGTSTVCTGVAARIEGTVVNEAIAGRARDGSEVRIGHPAGVIETESVVRLEGGQWQVVRSTLGRTARRILEGYVFVPESVYGDQA